MRYFAILFISASLFGSQFANGKETLEREHITSHTQLPLNVNPITGEYAEVEDDLVVVGAQPISYRRFYHGFGNQDIATGQWQINPQTTCFFNFAPGGDLQQCVVAGEATGSTFIYDKFSGHTCQLSNLQGFSNYSLSGQTHPLNTCVTHERVGQAVYFQYGGSIVSGNGSERHFLSDHKMWSQLSTDRFVFAKMCRPHFAQAEIQEERLPNGNIIAYDWKNISGQRVLTNITAWNHAHNCQLGSISICYDHAGPKHLYAPRQIIATGSDQRQATFDQELRTVVKKSHSRNRPFIFDILLRSVQTPHKPVQTYDFKSQKKTGSDAYKILDKYQKTKHLSQTTTAGGIPIDLSYDTSCRVVSFSTPQGIGATYEYHPDHTIVCDAEKGKTIYRFDENKRISSVERYDKDRLIQKESYSWDPSTGNLREHRLEGGLTTKYTYDAQHNVIVEQIGEQTIRRTFSKDRFNLLLSESDRKEKENLYTYVPHTNLPLTQFEKHHGRIVKRTFYTYDSQLNSVCVRTITDDGSSTNPQDLKNVTYRKIIEVIPKRDHPCLGLPVEVRESTINALGKKVPLHTIRYTYHPSGQIEKEEHYDSQKKLCYTLVNTYDAHERVASTKDALGHTTYFTYDDHFNLIAQRGPVCKEWKYDSMRRPIEEKWGDLVTTKQYDRCGRLIAETDASLQTTCFTYDDLGRCTKILYPDGAVEKREYDALGNLTKKVDPLGHITTTTYNARGQPLQITHPDGATESYSYDEIGHMLTLPDGSHAHFTYKGPYLHQVERKGHTYTYTKRNLAALPTEITLPEGSTLQITWDPLLRWEKVESPHYQAHYSYDAVGNLIQANDQHYSYDALHQLIQENNHSYSYDVFHNRLSKDGESYHLNALDQIIAYQYDPNGNLLSDGEREYTYDALDRLISVTTKKGTTSYTYDAFHRRMTKNNTRFIWDGKQEIGSPTELRILGEGYSEIGSTLFIELDEKSYFPIHDIQGSIVALIEEETYDYTAFGEEKCTSHLSPWRFAGKRYDEETGFVYFGRRYYAPTLGRWITPDPLEEGPNLYTYIHNSPFTLLDLHGLFSWQNAWAGTKEWGANTWNSPRFQGGVELATGVFESAAGAGLAIASQGAAAPIGFGIFMHGMDHVTTGMQAVYSGEFRKSASQQVLEKVGLSEGMAAGVDAAMSIFGTMGGGAVARETLSTGRWARAVESAGATVYEEFVVTEKVLPTKAQIHHICTNKNYLSKARGGPWSPRFEKPFKNVGLNLESKLNKVKVLGHKGPHPRTYHQTVFDRIGRATKHLPAGSPEYHAAFKAELKALSDEIAHREHILIDL